MRAAAARELQGPQVQHSWTAGVGGCRQLSEHVDEFLRDPDPALSDRDSVEGARYAAGAAVWSLQPALPAWQQPGVEYQLKLFIRLQVAKERATMSVSARPRTRTLGRLLLPW